MCWRHWSLCHFLFHEDRCRNRSYGQATVSKQTKLLPVAILIIWNNKILQASWCFANFLLSYTTLNLILIGISKLRVGNWNWNLQHLVAGTRTENLRADLSCPIYEKKWWHAVFEGDKNGPLIFTITVPPAVCVSAPVEIQSLCLYLPCDDANIHHMLMSTRAKDSFVTSSMLCC